MGMITLSKKDVKELNNEVHKRYGVEEFFGKDDFVAIEDDEFVLCNKQLVFFYIEDRLMPYLRALLGKNFLKKIVVDMGAVPHVAKGADIMRPGITGVDADVVEGDVVAIVDEKNMRPLAVGEALFSKSEMEDLSTGKVVLNIHHVGDDVWKRYQ